MSAWNPEQYQRFGAERLQAARDLVSLVEKVGGAAPVRAIDLGCGTGEATLLLGAHLGERAVIEGIDTSEEMLARAAPRARERLCFRRAAVEEIASFADYDVVFSNAALHWVPDHEVLFARLLGTLGPGAQLAVQMPWNGHHPSHSIAAAVAASEPFAGWLGGFVSRPATLALERYAQLFFDHGAGAGFPRTQLFEKVYSHRLERSGEVVEWVKGTTLVPYLALLEGARGAAFLDEYRRRLVGAIGDHAPYLFTFRRMFLWARKG